MQPRFRLLPHVYPPGVPTGQEHATPGESPLSMFGLEQPLLHRVCQWVCFCYVSPRSHWDKHGLCKRCVTVGRNCTRSLTLLLVRRLDYGDSSINRITLRCGASPRVPYRSYWCLLLRLFCCFAPCWAAVVESQKWVGRVRVTSEYERRVMIRNHHSVCTSEPVLIAIFSRRC